MISHLIIKANGKDLALPDNFSIDIEDANPLFNDNEMYTFPVSIPMDGNRHLVKNMEAINSDVRAVDVEHTKMQIIVDGIPYRSGVAVVDDAQDLDGNFDFSIQSMRESLEDKISDLECCDIPVKDKIQIGEILGDVKVILWIDYKVTSYFSKENGSPYGFYHYVTDSIESPNATSVEGEYSLQALGFSYPFVAKEGDNHEAVRDGDGPIKERNFINVSYGYSASSCYCNTRVCYKGMTKAQDGSVSDVPNTNTKYSPFTVLEADRPQSGINFYVLYFIECLFRYLKMDYDINSLMKVEDLKHLFFFNTSCKYDMERKEKKESYDLRGLRNINKWISSRAKNPSQCGQLEIKAEKKEDIESITINGETFVKGVPVRNPTIAPDQILVLSDCYSEVKDFKAEAFANIFKMYANSENFPKESISTILDGLYNSFGIRFVVNSETRKVKAILLRDVYRDSRAPIRFNCKVISVHKVSEKNTGVRMLYSVESDKKDQKQNVKYGVKDYDTNFDYIDYSKVDSALDYSKIIQKHSNFDMTTYVDKNTGNAYRLKVDSEAKTLSEFNARLFEVGGYKGIEIGDCSPVNEDFVTEFSIPWSPMLFTDVNIRNEMGAGNDNSFQMSDTEGKSTRIGFNNPTSRHQVFAAYFDEEMQEANAELKIDNPLPIDAVDSFLRENITTDESYDPGTTDDGNSPLQHADWGCAVGMMRGGGSDATLQQYDFNYDGFGNCKWRFVTGRYDANSDSIDNWGNEYDYNTSDIEGLGGEQFSLKIRAYKNDPDSGEPMINGVNPKIKNRGLFDTFMSEHAHFLLNRKKYKIVCECEIAALADIPNHWERRYQIGNVVGWINQISSSVSVKDGLGLVEIEMYSL